MGNAWINQAELRESLMIVNSQILNVLQIRWTNIDYVNSRRQRFIFLDISPENLDMDRIFDIAQLAAGCWYVNQVVCFYLQNMRVLSWSGRLLGFRRVSFRVSLQNSLDLSSNVALFHINVPISWGGGFIPEGIRYSKKWKTRLTFSGSLEIYLISKTHYIIWNFFPRTH